MKIVSDGYEAWDSESGVYSESDAYCTCNRDSCFHSDGDNGIECRWK